ncbi:unnamed protein product [Blepharisma stoltei]|uniref:EGF-like domain-containing protein n=1 Tax=Blepharisma stoltei TaxID=1481888 RepID=A0AAU9K8W9_9CILI|nr:unnamed protein product [Blepharisma stoltei]
MVLPMFILILMLQASAMQNNIIEHEESSDGDFKAPITDPEILNQLFQNNDDQLLSQEIRSNATEKERKLTAACTNGENNCQTCASATLCGTCLLSNTIPDINGGCTQTYLKNCALVSSDTVCSACKAGYYQGCKSCSDLIPGCTACSDDGRCVTCGSGYLLDGMTSTCMACSNPLCDSCPNNMCIKCKSGYFADGSTCKDCPSYMTGCQECSNSDKCTKCVTGYILNENSQCTQSSIPNCIALNSGTMLCVTCASGYYENGGSCTQIPCTSTQYWDATLKECKGCNTINLSCITCSSYPRCTSCSAGKIADDYGLCTPSTLSNCAMVRATDPNYCVKCSTGYTSNGAGGCRWSPLKYCNAVSDAYTCTACSSGAANSCGSCNAINLFPNCACASQEGSFCVKCNDGYIVKAGSCSKDCSSNCEDCTSKDVCTQCKSGYFLYDESATKTSCVSCADSCNLCTNSPICFECADLIVQDGSSCRVDKVGYQLSFDSPDAVIDFAHALSKVVAFDSFTAKKGEVVVPTGGWSVKSSTISQIKVQTDLDVSQLPIDVTFSFKEIDS